MKLADWIGLAISLFGVITPIIGAGRIRRAFVRLLRPTKRPRIATRKAVEEQRRPAPPPPPPPPPPSPQRRIERKIGFVPLLLLELVVCAALIAGMAAYWSHAGWLGYSVYSTMTYEKTGVSPLSLGAVLGWGLLAAALAVALGAFSALNKWWYGIVLYVWIPPLSRGMLDWFGNVSFENHRILLGALIATLGIIAGRIVRHTQDLG